VLQTPQGEAVVHQCHPLGFLDGTREAAGSGLLAAAKGTSLVYHRDKQQGTEYNKHPKRPGVLMHLMKMLRKSYLYYLKQD